MSRKRDAETAAALGAGPEPKAPRDETTAQSVNRQNDHSWDQIRPLMAAGGELRRDAKTKHFYVDGWGGLTARRVSRLEEQKLIVRIGVDTYGLPVETTSAAPPSALEAEPETASAPIRSDAPVADEKGLVAPAEIRYRETLTIDQVVVSPLNPRGELVDTDEELDAGAIDIVQKGLLQPLLARPKEWDAKKGPFAGCTKAELIIGARRREWIRRAVAGVTDKDGKLWKLPDDFAVPLRLRHPTSDDDLVILAGTENLRRRDMPPLREAMFFDILRKRIPHEPGQTPEAATGALFGISEATVFRRLRLLHLDEVAQAELSAGRLSLQDAQLLAGETSERQVELIEEARDRIAPEPEVAPEPLPQPLYADRELARIEERIVAENPDPPQPIEPERASPEEEKAALAKEVGIRPAPPRPTAKPTRLSIHKPPAPAPSPVSSRQTIDTLVATLKEIALSGDGPRDRKQARICLKLQGFALPEDPAEEAA